MVGKKLEMYEGACGTFFTVDDIVLYEDYGTIFKGKVTKVTDSCIIINGIPPNGYYYRQVYLEYASKKIVLLEKGKYHDWTSNYCRAKESAANRRS